MTEQVAAVLTGPLLGATAVAALLLVVLADEAVGALVTLVHEAGHMVVAAVTGRRIDHFQVFRPGEGVTYSAKRGWGPSRILGPRPATLRHRSSVSGVRPSSPPVVRARCCGRRSS